MRPIVTNILEAAGSLIAALVIVGLCVLLFGCSRPNHTPAVAAPAVAPDGDADDCPGGVCVGDDCLVPRAMR